MQITNANPAVRPSPPPMDGSFPMLRHLLPFSPVVAKFILNISGGEINVQEQAELIESDAAFAAELLRHANSALFVRRFPITGIFDALSVLGINRVASLAATLGLCRLVKTVSNLPATRACWRHNLATALLARDGAQSLGIDPDQGYMFGLLSGLGQLALLAAQPVAYSQLLDRALIEHIAIEVLEAQRFGIDNHQAGTWLVAEWKLPVELLTVFPPMRESRLGCLITEAKREATHFGFGIPPLAALDPKDPAALHIAGRVAQMEQDLGV